MQQLFRQRIGEFFPLGVGIGQAVGEVFPGAALPGAVGGQVPDRRALTVAGFPGIGLPLSQGKGGLPLRIRQVKVLGQFHLQQRIGEHRLLQVSFQLGLRQLQHLQRAA